MFRTSGMRKGGKIMTINEVDGPLIGRPAHGLAHLTRLVPRPYRGETRSQWFDRHPASVAAARGFTRDTLGEQPLEESETVELLVSELVTNAVRHGAGPILLSVTVRGTSLRCEVTDAHPAFPCLKAAGADDESGRGMQLLHELSHRCGVRTAHQGKTVWFELRARGLAEASVSASVPALGRFARPAPPLKCQSAIA
ncbi:ATP-binding protein [Streptomyces lunaelactis]|uniref:ATP-binding protein n=2 Tax=Streptomyces lunaelactis TaxID=1535768 RepID=UPI0015854709|nr:ATP-binding protein [Streptomyces lunaelactis]NUK07035.1 ATP-binding protein [Streptomyces lunaelactis]NUK23210.1 ATP-binding protein [Streptomyces lunaelactis]NUK50004.1 ATP-binding protein [Streptomyces lunaelactis]NUK63356.1 ATP-binding protein [Streptomyces lunaelactis]NUK69708.1 ATP-binding protein [Streptomyces lunaelactis]